MECNTQPGAARFSKVVLPFAYPSGPDPQTPAWSGLASLFPGSAGHCQDSNASATDRGETQLKTEPMDDACLKEEMRRSFDTGRRAGLEEGRAAARQELSESDRAEKNQYMQRVTESLASLAEHRDRYLKSVESEVVALALGIAARILRREVQIDPLLLTGAVRVAVGQLSDATKAQLLVPPAEFEMWKETFVHLSNLPLQPEILAGNGMLAGECVLRTEIGSVDLGLSAQLKEIERGFFDKFPVDKARRGHVVASDAHAK